MASFFYYATPKKDRSLSPKLPISTSKKWLIRFRWLAIGYSIFCTLLFFQQQRLMFFPFRDYPHTPDLYKLNYQDVWLPIPTRSGKVDRLHGWWIPAEKSNAPIMLYFHHNAVNIGANVSQARQFHKLGYSILLMDYRGFGQSEGDFPTESQVYEDAQAAWNYLTQDRKISAKQIVIYGHSIGGAIAIDLASKHPEASALIVQSTFTSM
jgi:acetyl esterase/lipase